MSNEHPLIRLIDDAGVLKSGTWNKESALLKRSVPVDCLINSDEVQALLDGGLLRKPYFTVLKQGVEADLLKVTKNRNVAGQVVGNFANPNGIRAELARGATLKLNQLEDWHRPTRGLVKSIEQRIPAELKGYIFYTPQDNTGMLPHRDPAHVIAVQLEGTKRWRLFASEGQVDARGGLNVDTTEASHDFVMEPGDVLYLPHGYPHVATTEAGTSLHLTLTLSEPGPLNLLEALIETCAGSHPFLFNEPGLTLEERAKTVAATLAKEIESVSSKKLVEKALQMMRRRTVA